MKQLILNLIILYISFNVNVSATLKTAYEKQMC